MPFVTINVLEGKDKEYIRKASDAINSAVIETMAFPDEDRIMMHLVMRSGRSNKSKQAFYKKVAENLQAEIGIKPENIFITITENHDVDFSFRDGIAQFVV